GDNTTNTSSTSNTITGLSAGTYTVSVYDAEGCEVIDIVTVSANPQVTPTFNAVGPYCEGDAIPALPTTSTNGITGSWSPAIDNTTTTTYTFTPAAGECATTTTLTITITPQVTPTFNAVGPYCEGYAIPALPTTSLEGIIGSWSPAIDNTMTTTYTFTPDAGQCAATTTLTITVSPNPTTSQRCSYL
ncbi:MAG: gliding motility-associated C-terminal domain-containing protein, partial [Bacteroidota bacterium]|nr:gliding motility-associated C-terminal domain-containing protein [Bacteroidota bacterium]